MRIKRQYWAFLLAVAAVVLLIDQVTKGWVVDNLAMYESRAPIPALGEVFRITRSYNTGAAFGFLENGNAVFLVLSLIIVSVILWYYPRLPAGVWLVRIAMGLIIGGALGNAVDRLTYGHVVDFIHYRIPNLISNVSNLADHAIVFGVVLILLDNLRQSRRKTEAEAAAPAPPEVEPPASG